MTMACPWIILRIVDLVMLIEISHLRKSKRLPLDGEMPEHNNVT